MTKLSRWCDGLIELCWLAAVIISPLFFNIHSDRVFEPDKITLIRSFAIIMVVVWVIKFVDLRKWQSLKWLKWSAETSIWKLPFILPTAAVAIAYVVANIFSVTPSVSWFGSYQRLQGTYTTLSYIVIFALVAATIRTHAQVRRIITAVIISSIPVALYGMLQRFGLDPLPWGGNVQTRIAGHMGNSIFVGAYLIMAVPVTLARIMAAFTSILSDEELNTADIIRSSIYIFTLAIQLIAIYWTGSRGPMLGLAVGIFAFISIFLVALRNTISDQKRYTGRDIFASAFGLILGLVALFLAANLRSSLGDMNSFLLFIGMLGVITLSIFILIALRRGWKWLWLSWILTTGFIGLWLVFFNLSGALVGPYGEVPVVGGVVRTLNAWQQLPAVGRYGRLLESESGTGRVRVLIWEGTIDLITPHEPIEYPDGTRDRFNVLRPLIGYGPEAMYVAYNRFYPPELALFEARNASPDRSHNETWDAFVITGALGFLAWQWLYLSVFYYSFKWLNVVQSKRDRNIFVGLWIFFGILLAIAFALWRGPEFIGVALPFGSIIGLVVYLTYYAIVARPSKETAAIDPFRADRLLMISLIGAVIAHYVEIHFGIAIVATRVHFFVYAALMLIMGHLLPVWREQTYGETAGATSKPAPKGRRRRGRRRRSELPRWVAPTFIWTFLLGLIVTILGYNFSVYTPPPGTIIETLSDVPSAVDIFWQSFFVNPLNNFADSPFIFLLVVMSWGLGSLVAISEMIKSHVLSVPAATRQKGNEQTIAIIFIAMTILFVGVFLVGWLGLGVEAARLTTTQRIGMLTLAPLGALLSGQAAVSLYRKLANGRLTAGAVALTGLALSIPVMIAGGTWYGLLVAVVSLAILYLLWDANVRVLLIPAAVISLFSFAIGMGFTLLHASQIRESMLVPPDVTETTSEIIRRVAEARQFAGVLTLFYIFLFMLLLLFAFGAAARRLRKTSDWGSWPGWGALIVLLPLAFILIRATNLQVIQADMIYKRGKPWDSQAPQAGTPEQSLRLWDNAIGIYNYALDLVPQEDFYYLWLGRAYLEKASLLSEQPIERDEVLNTAEESLFTAQAINPLNTDHTANLARLNTRWASMVSEPEREEKLEAFERHYQAAIELSPQNAVIRNEYARAIYAFEQDCDESLRMYQESAEADPFYAGTQFEIAEIQIACASALPAEERDRYYETIEEHIRTGVELTALEPQARERQPLEAQIPRIWAQAGQFFQESGVHAQAVTAFEEARNYPTDQFPAWRTDYLLANAYAQAGDTEQAQAVAQRALQAAPPEAAPQIQELIGSLPAAGE